MAKSCEETSSVEIYNGRTLISSQINGDYNYGVLMSFTADGKCEEVTGSGLLKILGIKYAIKQINENPSLLKDIKIGYQFHDNCLNLPISMWHGIQIINKYRNQQCYVDNFATCADSYDNSSQVVGIIGAYFSFTTVSLASLFGLHTIPMISAHASIPLLSKKATYHSFFRTTSPDTYTVQAMIDVMIHFNWTYIFVVGSDDDYGKLAITELKKLAAKSNICITGDVYLPFETEETKEVAYSISKEIESHPEATVVVMFTYAVNNGEFIIKEADQLGLSRIWLTSDAWNPDALYTNYIPLQQLQNIITVSLKHGTTPESFIKYINESINRDFSCNVWLNNYIDNTFNCKINRSTDQDLIGENCNETSCVTCKVTKETVLQQVLHESPDQVNKLIDAIYAMSYGLNSAINSLRSGNQNYKPSVKPNKLTDAIKLVKFTNQRNETFEFDSNGDPKFNSFSIEQPQSINNKTKFIQIGKWTQGKLSISNSLTEWPEWTSFNPPRSTCSDACLPGQFRIGIQGCCWACQQCETGTYSNTINADACLSCPEGHYTDDAKSCKKTEVTYLRYSDAIAITTLIFISFGVIFVVSSIIIFFKINQNNNIMKIKAAKIIGAIALLIATFMYPIFHIVEPTKVICDTQNVYFYLIITIYNSLLLAKNPSVSHFITKRLHRNMKVITTQIFVVVAIVVFQIALIMVLLLKEANQIEIDQTDQAKYLVKCVHKFSTNRLLAYAFPSIVLLVATVQSVAESKSHSRDVGAKFLMYACLTMVLVNIAYFITVNNVLRNYQQLVIIFLIILYGFVYFCLILCPNFYVIWNTLINVNVNDTGKITGFDNACYDKNDGVQNGVNLSPYNNK